MKIPALFLAFVFSAASASASLVHHGAGIGHVVRHVSIAQRAASSLEKKGSAASRKKCRAKTETSAAPSSTQKPSSTPAAPKSSAQPTSAPAVAKPAPSPATNNNNNNNHNNGGGGGVLYKSGPCGESRATQETTRTSGPNGDMDWLNCGVENGGWKPPYISIWEVKVKPLSTALQDPDSPFKACAQFIWLFEKYGNQHGIPPIILASIAMQESSCNPNTVGGGGEQGLMQITHDKCGGAPGGDCRQPEFNIATGARYFAETLQRNGGNVVTTMGNYNGWPVGMTVGSATAARWSNCCRCQNNLDYLQQIFNGWFQNINAYNSAHRLGKYFNLDPCQ